MIATWMAYLAGISALLGMAALLMEGVLLRHGLATRWVWLASIVGTVVLPAFVSLVRSPAGTASGEAGSMIAGPVAMMGGIVSAPGPALDGLDPMLVGALDEPLILVWVALSSSLLLFVIASRLDLRRRRREWRRRVIDGTPVWQSRDVGPAIVGFVRGEIVVPGWIDGLTPAERGLLLRHEREHLRARDGRLLALGLGILVLVPWNPFLWWNFRRMRAAIEIDCDARVLAPSGDVGGYGALLLEVGRRATRMPLIATAFSRPTTQLERRIRTIVGRNRQSNRAASLAMAVGGILFVLAACSMDSPSGNLPTARFDGPSDRSDSPASADGTASAEPTSLVEGMGRQDQENPLPEPAPEPARAPDSSSRMTGEPTFVATDVRPSLRNPMEVGRAIEQGYPGPLKEAGIGGTTTVWIHIDETGSVDDVRIHTSSGHPELDDTSIAAIRTVARFSPARDGDTPKAAWIQLPITFRVDQ